MALLVALEDLIILRAGSHAPGKGQGIYRSRGASQILHIVRNNVVGQRFIAVVISSAFAFDLGLADILAVRPFHIQIGDLSVDEVGIIVLRQHIVTVFGKAAGTNTGVGVIIVGGRFDIARLFRASEFEVDIFAVDIDAVELADRADMVFIPFVIDGALKIRSIRCRALRTGIGNIATGHAGAAVALRGPEGVAVRAGMVSVLALRRELVFLDDSVCKDDLFAVCGRKQTTESIVAFRFQCRTADCASDRSSGHIVLAGAIHRVLAHLRSDLAQFIISLIL